MFCCPGDAVPEWPGNGNGIFLLVVIFTTALFPCWFFRKLRPNAVAPGIHNGGRGLQWLTEATVTATAWATRITSHRFTVIVQQ